MCKERFFCNDYDDVFKTVPRQVRTIMHNLDKIRDAERPDYTFLGMMLLSMREDFPFLLNGPFDFQKDNLKVFHQMDAMYRSCTGVFRHRREMSPRRSASESQRDWRWQTPKIARRKPDRNERSGYVDRRSCCPGDLE